MNKVEYIYRLLRAIIVKSRHIIMLNIVNNNHLSSIYAVVNMLSFN